MRYSFIGKNIAVTNKLKERSEIKLGKLKKFFKEDTEVFVTMSMQRNMQIYEVMIPYNGVVFRAETSSDDMFTSMDKAVDIIERQIRKNKTRLEKKLRENAFDPNNFIDNENVDEEQDFRIIKAKKIPVKPMDIEEAILQMNLIGHAFFMFINASTNVVNVVYKRNDGEYGLIEPEM